MQGWSCVVKWRAWWGCLAAAAQAVCPTGEDGASVNLEKIEELMFRFAFVGHEHRAPRQFRDMRMDYMKFGCSEREKFAEQLRGGWDPPRTTGNGSTVGLHLFRYAVLHRKTDPFWEPVVRCRCLEHIFIMFSKISIKLQKRKLNATINLKHI